MLVMGYGFNGWGAQGPLMTEILRQRQAAKNLLEGKVVVKPTIVSSSYKYLFGQDGVNKAPATGCMEYVDDGGQSGIKRPHEDTGDNSQVAVDCFPKGKMLVLDSGQFQS